MQMFIPDRIGHCQTECCWEISWILDLDPQQKLRPELSGCDTVASFKMATSHFTFENHSFLKTKEELLDICQHTEFIYA